jgi:hypothetical protein
MRMRSFVLGAVVFVVSLPAAVQADPIRIQSIGRVAIGGARLDNAGLSQEDAQRDAPHIGSFARVFDGADSAAGTSSLLTGITAATGEVFGLGSATARSETAGQPAFAHASTGFFVTFEAESPLDYDLAGFFGSSGQQTSEPNPYQFGNWTAQLRPASSGGGPALFAFDAYDDRFVRERGLLTPGLYTFQVGLQSVANSTSGLALGFSEFNFSLNLTPSDVAATPEPASLVLLGSGIIGLLGLRRSTKPPE